MGRLILVRMAEALNHIRNCDGRSWRTLVRTPKAFYLNEADGKEFDATNPPQITASFRGMPTSEPGFEGVPVRRATGGQSLRASKLYSEAGTSKQISPT
jgi:hypothetical protein